MERNRGGRPRHPDVLTPAEWRVLDALREGGTNAEIASRLGLSPDTVKYHISNMLAKLELHDRRALAAWRPEGRREGLGALFALPAALWSLARPLAWVGAGVASLAGVAVVVVALVALEGIVERDADSPAALAPPTTSTPAGPPSAPGSCATPADPTCIHAVYIGAPSDYAQVVDIPSAMRLNAGPGGTYHVDAGLEVTVVTAARLPSGWTRFYLEPSPVIAPVSVSRLIQPVGTTYTFTVEGAPPFGVTVINRAPTSFTYHLKQAKPFVRPRPDGKPHTGAPVVETEFVVKDCSSGVAVTNPATNTELVSDCESLLGLRDTIRGTGRLNWTAGKAMSEWMGVTVSGTPQRVTALNLADLGLDGQLSGLLGNLTGLTALDLSGNPLTGMLPSKLALLESLTTVSISGASFTGCAPEVLGATATNDVTLDDCAAPRPFFDAWGVTDPMPTKNPIPEGTYILERGRDGDPMVFDWPPDTGLIPGPFLNVTPPVEGQPVLYGDLGLLLVNAEGTVEIAIDIRMGSMWPVHFRNGFTHEGTVTGYTRAEYEAILQRVLDSIWLKAD